VSYCAALCCPAGSYPFQWWAKQRSYDPATPNAAYVVLRPLSEPCHALLCRAVLCHAVLQARTFPSGGPSSASMTQAHGPGSPQAWPPCLRGTTCFGPTGPAMSPTHSHCASDSSSQREQRCVASCVVSVYFGESWVTLTCKGSRRQEVGYMQAKRCAASLVGSLHHLLEGVCSCDMYCDMYWRQQSFIDHKFGDRASMRAIAAAAAAAPGCQQVSCCHV
jgi:hypothetical protein